MLAIAGLHTLASPLGAHPTLRHCIAALAALQKRVGVCSSSWAAGAERSAAAAAPPVAAVPVDRLQRAISPQVCERLRRDGYAVVDNVLGEPASAALRAEVAALRGSMHKNCTHLVAGGATGLLEKEHVWEAELMLAATQALAPLAAQLQNDATLRVMLSVLMLELSLQSQAIKLQWNAGGGWGGPFAEKEGEGHGGCFPMHFDTDSSLDTRRVTTIWYLNPGWRPGDGGELRVYPFPQSPVDIAPLNDRMVLFSSQRMLHRVLPSQAERYCFTIWLSEGGARRPGGAPASGSDGGGLGGGGGAVQRQRAELRRALATDQPLGTEEAWHLARHPELFKHAVKWLFRAEWERSLRESHPAGPALEQALAQFRREIGVMERALAPLLPALAAGPPAGGLPPLAWF